MPSKNLNIYNIMENLKITKLQAVGLFVITTIVAIFLVINFLKGESLFKKQNTFYTEYNDIAGITISTPIYVKGYKVGAVENITYNAENSSYIVEFTVKDEYSIPTDSKAEIFSADIMGTKSIRIAIGEAKTFAEDNQTLKGAFAPDIISMLSEKVGPLATQLSSVMVNLDSALINVNTILNNSAKEDIHSALENLNKTLANAQNITKNLSSSSPELQEIISNFNALSKELNNGSEHITNSLENIDNLTTQLSKAELEVLIDNLNSLLENLQNPNGSFGKLMTTDSLHNSLNTILNNIDTLVQKITENPKKYIKVSVF